MRTLVTDLARCTRDFNKERKLVYLNHVHLLKVTTILLLVHPTIWIYHLLTHRLNPMMMVMIMVMKIKRTLHLGLPLHPNDLLLPLWRKSLTRIRTFLVQEENLSDSTLVAHQHLEFLTMKDLFLYVNNPLFHFQDGILLELIIHPLDLTISMVTDIQWI